MRALFITDFHGHRWKYGYALDYASRNEISVIINGGDMYPDDYGSLFESHTRFLNGYFEEWLKLLADRDIVFVGLPGNDDLASLDYLFDEICDRNENALNVHGRLVTLDGYEYLGINFVKDYPFELKDRCRRDTRTSGTHDILQRGKPWLSLPNGSRDLDVDEYLNDYLVNMPSIEEELEKLPTPKNWSETIFISHDPPYGVGLDVIRQGQVGSKAVATYIDKNQPLLSLHGHIHQSPAITGEWQAKLGNTLSIQPGQEKDECRIVLIDTDKKSVTLIGANRGCPFVELSTTNF